MSEDDRDSTLVSDPAPLRAVPAPPGPPNGRNGRPRIRRLRVALILIPLGILALVSTVFGMMMAVASDLPALDNRSEFTHAQNSVLYDVQGRELGILTGSLNRILLPESQISPLIENAVISVEDQRFKTNAGIDIRGIARAFIQDVLQKKAVQGASTITQQFVKNALAAQAKRTVFQKLREAALAYHLTRKWSKKKILREYLNSIYFGNGAYGVESAARTYFQVDHQLGDPCGGGPGQPPCASLLKPYEAALLAGLVSSPSAYDPVAHPEAAKARRNLVLKKMRDQGFITTSEYADGIDEALPARQSIHPPREISKAPYFTTWVKQQVVDQVGAGEAFGGGLKIRTTLDLDLQAAAQQAIRGRLAGVGPSAALVAIDNATGQVRAMVGGDDQNFSKRPFNLATQGQRQPGSAFKPFVLAAALKQGISPGSLWSSQKKIFTVPGSRGKEHFVVNNYEGNYTGTSTLARATTFSDNSVYAEVGIKVGTNRIARTAERMGIRTPVSRNYAITLGGLRQGVTTLDMAHAYETLAQGGNLVTGTLGASDDGPVGIKEIDNPNGKPRKKDEVERKQVIPPNVANTAKSILATVVTQGTGKAADLGSTFAAGKTGTTENYGDAWFVGFTDKLTVAVWVGYPDKLVPMKTLYRGQPVAGGTYPTEVWHDFMVSAIRIFQARDVARAAKQGKTLTTTTPVPTTAVPSAPAPTTTTPSSGKGGGKGTGGGNGGTNKAPSSPTPAPAQPTPAAPPTNPAPGGAPPSQGGGAGAPGA